MNVITMSLVIVTLFLGGPQPVEIGGSNLLGFLGPLGGTVWLVLKLLAFLYIYVWFRATLPRLRYDQLMDFGWKVLIPVSLGWFLVFAALREFSPDGDWDDSRRGRDQPRRRRSLHRAARRRAAGQQDTTVSSRQPDRMRPY